MSSIQNTFWINNPTILFHKSKINQLWPDKSFSSDEKLNAITRLVILLTLLGYLVTRRLTVVFTGVITLGVIIVLYYAQKSKTNGNDVSHQRMKESIKDVLQEGFSNSKIYEKTKPSFTNPSKKNPAMNVLLTEINDKPNRKPAAPAFNPSVEKQMNEETQKFVTGNDGAFNENDSKKQSKLNAKIFKDLGDSFDFDQSMRQFYATPNTKIPNDQKSFAEFLYGDMVSCKEGHELACIRHNPRHINY